jgi:hypothetical protein
MAKDAQRDAEYTAIVAEADRRGVEEVHANPQFGFPAGFVAIHITPGTTSFARWLLRTENGEPAGRPNGGGVFIWVRLKTSDFPEWPLNSLSHPLAAQLIYASAYIQTLAEHDIPALVWSHVD